MKTSIYHLIILDESGSMGGVWDATISGCNETITTIKASQKEFSETQDHFVSIYAFQSECAPSRYLIKNVPAEAVNHITREDYQPGGCTPLYDAVGSTLVDLKVTVKNKQKAVGNVTIITDGYENSSREYTQEKVAKMIDKLKELGWSFNFIGANIDVAHVSLSLNIDNAMAFVHSESGTREMFERERKSRRAWSRRVDEAMACAEALPDCSEEIVRKAMRKASKGYFDKE